MAELVLGLGRQDAECLGEAVGNKECIITKAARANFFREELSFDTAMGDMQHRAISGEDHAAAEASAEARVLRLLGEFGFQFRAVVSGIGIFSRIASASHTWRTTENIDLKTGIIRENKQAGNAAAAAHGFDDGVRLKGVACFFIKRDTGMGAEIFNLPLLSEDGGDFFSLVGIGGGEDESGHRWK